MKTIRIASFAIVMLLYLWFPFQMINSSQEVLQKGNLYRFKPEPVDPYDAFRGRYVELNFLTKAFTVSPSLKMPDPEQKVYVSLGKDSLGYAFFDQIHYDPPGEKDYIETTISYSNGRELHINIPENMQRFYLNEELAPQAEKVYRELARENRNADTIAVYLDVRVLEGTVVMEELYFRDLPVGEYLRELDRAE